MTTTLSAKGQIVIPRAIRAQDELRPGDDFVIERVGPGRIVLERISRRAQGAKVVRRKKGLPVVKPPKGAPRLTSQAVKALENYLFPVTRPLDINLLIACSGRTTSPIVLLGGVRRRSTLRHVSPPPARLRPGLVQPADRLRTRGYRRS